MQRRLPVNPDTTAPSQSRKITTRVVQALLLVAIVAGTVGFVAFQKTVTLSIDGATRTVHTFAGDVEGVLDRQSIDGVHPRPRLAVVGQRDRRRRDRHRPLRPAADPRRRRRGPRGLDHGAQRRRGARPARHAHRRRRALRIPLQLDRPRRPQALDAAAEDDHDRRRRRCARDHDDRAEPSATRSTRPASRSPCRPRRAERGHPAHRRAGDRRHPHLDRERQRDDRAPVRDRDPPGR